MIKVCLVVTLFIVVFSSFSGCTDQSQCLQMIEAIKTFQPEHLNAPAQFEQRDFLRAQIHLLLKHDIELPKSWPSDPAEQCVHTIHWLAGKFPETSKEQFAVWLLDDYVQQWDPHSRAIASPNVLAGSIQEGFGLTIERSRKDGKIRIADIILGSPAHSAGLRRGLVIQSINRVETSKIDVENLFDREKLVKLILSVSTDTQTREVTLTREQYQVQPFELEVDDVSYLRVRSLHATKSAIARDLNSVQKSNALILDLRNISGGEIQAAADIADALSEADIFAGFLGRNGTLLEPQTLDIDSLWDKPLVVLVNSETKSSAEALAGALQDYGAILVGTRTFGKGTNHLRKPLQNFGMNATLEITTSFLVRPSGKIIQKYGVTPDVALPVFREKRFESNYTGALEAPQDQPALLDYDRTDVPFGGGTFRDQLQRLQREIFRQAKEYNLGPTMEQQYIAAARRVAHLMIEAKKAMVTELPAKRSRATN